MSNQGTSHSEQDSKNEHAHKKHGKHKGPHGGHEAHEEGVPEWMISFADNALLQMGFFVILLAITLKQLAGMAPVNVKAGVEPTEGAQTTAHGQTDMIDAAIAIRSGFNNPVRLDSGDPRDAPLIRRILEQAAGEGRESGPKGDGQKLQSLRPTDYRAIAGALSFGTNSTELTEASRAVVLDVARRVRGMTLVVEIRGHASAAEAFDQSQSAMRLSFERALTVANEMSKYGVDWRQMRLIGCGDNDRLEQTVYTADEQRLNQRVEIVLTNELMPASKAMPQEEEPSRPAEKPSTPAKTSSTPAEKSAAPAKSHAAPAKKSEGSSH